MYNGAIYWVKLGSNGISYNLNGTGSKDSVLKSKVVKHKLEECSGKYNTCMYIYILIYIYI